MGTTSYSYDLPGTVSAVFFTKKDADNAFKALLRLGHTEDDISLLMSDETLNKHANPPNEGNVSDPDTSDAEPGDDSKEGTKHVLADAIISITSLISLPELGIWISRKLTGSVTVTPVERSTKDESIGEIIATKIPKEHCDTYHTGMKEGGIIISVDPKNRAEMDAIIREFKNNNGHDILGDDGYTELDNSHHFPG
jgi:hypothetical protein